MGLEKTPEEYVSKLVEIFREVKRVLKGDGTLWLNLGDSYASSSANGGQCDFSSSGLKRDGRSEESRLRTLTQNAKEMHRLQPVAPRIHGLKPKDLVGIPWMTAFALRADGWYLRSDIIWSKPNPMPESVTDRPTKSHEYIFLLSKSERYYFDQDAVREPHETGDRKGQRRSYKPGSASSMNRDEHQVMTGSFAGLPLNPLGRNCRSVWAIPTVPYADAHFATFPPKLIEPCILAGSKAGDVVLDPFAGSGTTDKVAIELGRKAILIELKPEYIEMIEKRCTTTMGFNFEATA